MTVDELTDHALKFSSRISETDAVIEMAHRIHALQAQLEAVREKDAVKLSLNALRDAYDDLEGRHTDLQAALDAERIRREQVEMENYAKDGQIETLQAERDRLREGLERIARYGKDGICPYGCDTPNIATAALTPAAGGTRHG